MLKRVCTFGAENPGYRMPTADSLKEIYVIQFIIRSNHPRIPAQIDP